jgi:cytochrome c biogenesis protein CcdA
MTDPTHLSILAALLLGLGFGMGPCAVSCLPYLGPVFLTADGTRRAWRYVVPFSAGRLTGYTLLGAVAGFIGASIERWLNTPAVHWVLGGATLLVAVVLWFRLRRNASCHTGVRGFSRSVRFEPHSPAEASTSNQSDLADDTLPGGLFVMGMGMAFNPCAPLSTILLAAAASGTLIGGLGLGMGFGAGAVMIPTLLFALGVARFGEAIREGLGRWRNQLENLAVALLAVTGGMTALGWMMP